VTAPAAQAIAPGQMVAIMGTSTCHVMNHDALVEVPGMCGVVHGGITPGLWGYEAGQSGVGDIFGWFAGQVGGDHAELSRAAAAEPAGAHGLLALDWLSGNRSVLVDHELSGVIVGLTLATRPHQIYRALVEATAFGARLIVETFEAAGVPVDDFVVAGGLMKNPFVMQVYADVLRRPLHLIGSDQGPALGAAIHAAVAAEAYATVEDASAAMGRQRRDAYLPDAAAADVYDELYAHYVRLHDHFGRGGDDVLHALRRPRRELARD
jgi:L-ribulokinase